MVKVQSLILIGLLCLVMAALVVAQSGGVLAWSGDSTVNTAVCTASGDQQVPLITSDGSGGAIITWYDNRSGNRDIYAQRVNSDGAAQWTADGVAICTASGDQYPCDIIPDGVGGSHHHLV